MKGRDLYALLSTPREYWVGPLSCLQNILSYSCHRLNKVLEKIVRPSGPASYSLSAARPGCEFPVPPHPKDVFLALSTVKSLCWRKQFELTDGSSDQEMGTLSVVVFKGGSVGVQRYQAPLSIPSSLNCWYKVEWTHALMLFTPSYYLKVWNLSDQTYSSFGEPV